jgi:phage gp45-like
MHRAEPVNSSFRAYVAGGARATVNEVDDSKLMQEHISEFLYQEKREKIETPQNYGFTSVCMDADKDKDGNVTASAETFITFIGGNRSFPVSAAMDDRRHRLNSLEKGDAAMYRLKDDRQQIHMTKDGTFVSTRDDKIMRVALVPKKDDQQQQQGGGQQSNSQKYGQKNCLDDNKNNSKTFWEQNEDFYVIRRGNGWIIVTDQYVHIYNGSGGDQLTEPDKSKHGSHTYITDDHVHTFTKDGDNMSHVYLTKDHIHLYSDKGHLYISKDEVVTTWGPTGDESISTKVDANHAHLRYKGNTVWVNNGGCFSSVPMQTAADPDSGGSQIPDPDDPDPIKHQTSSS